jgi:hypothetical protein
MGLIWPRLALAEPIVVAERERHIRAYREAMEFALAIPLRTPHGFDGRMAHVVAARRTLYHATRWRLSVALVRAVDDCLDLPQIDPTLGLPTEIQRAPTADQ